MMHVTLLKASLIIYLRSVVKYCTRWSIVNVINVVTDNNNNNLLAQKLFIIVTKDLDVSKFNK